MFKKILLVSALVVTGAGLHYAVPQTDVVRAVGIETKRMDREGDAAKIDAQKKTRDVYFIQTEDIDDQSPMVYRNEDQIFPYLKWSSADQQSRAQSLGAEKALVAVRHYGWRIRFFNMFPNTLKISPVETAYTPIPYLLLICLALVWGAIIYAYYRIGVLSRKIKEKISARREARRTPTRDEAAAARDAEIDDFLSSAPDDAAQRD